MPPGLYVGLSSGNVGIGTTGIAGSSNAFNLTTTGAPGAITALANGNVGIGTTNPLAKLDVNGTIKATQLAVSGILIGFAYQNTNTLYTLTGGFANTGVTVTYTPKSNNSTLIVVANLQLELVRASGSVSRGYLNIYRDGAADTSANNKRDTAGGSFQHHVLHQSGGATNVYAYNTTTITHQWVNTSTAITTFQVYGYSAANETVLINANGRSEMYVFELLN
jgi:hypothetical protein